MEKRSRNITLAFGCVIILSGLITVQLYLLQNTYKLSLDSYHNEVRNAVLKINYDADYKMIEDQYKENLILCSQELIDGKIDAAQFRQRLNLKDVVVSQKLDSLLRKNEAFNVKLKGIKEYSEYKSIVIESGNRIVKPLSESPAKMSNAPEINVETISMGENTGETIQADSASEEIRITYRISKRLVISEIPQSVRNELILVGGISLLLFSGVVVLFYIILRSARRQRKIAELRTDLVNNITHELKTPLSSMSIAFTTLKKLDAPFPEQQKQLISIIERQSKKLSQTVERVLESAVNNEDSRHETVDLYSILEHYSNLSASENHSLKIEVNPEKIRVYGSASVIETALDNLLENAVKYSEAGTSININGRTVGEFYEIQVSDQGKGIAKEHRQQLFEKFYRVPEKNLHHVKGLGLGLYLSRKSIRETGGDIRLSSTSEHGSTFTIFLKIV